MPTLSVVRERYPHRGIEEHRVSLTPQGVEELASYGIQIVVESGAGQAAGFSDLEYQSAGARLVYSHEEALGRADILVKVAPLTPQEVALLPKKAFVFSFGYLSVAPPRLLATLRERQITFFALELLQEKERRPILAASSEIAGRMSLQIASSLLESPEGIGLLLSGTSVMPPADVVIVGAGTLGRFAAQAFKGAGASVYALDINLNRLEKLHMDLGIVTAPATRYNLRKFVSFAEVLVLAVSVPGEPAPLLLDQEDLRAMRRGSVILDFSIDHGGSTAVTRERGPQRDPYSWEGRRFFAVPNVPSRVARTASHALTYALLPFLKRFLDHGWPDILHVCEGLQRALVFQEGQAL